MLQNRLIQYYAAEQTDTIDTDDVQIENKSILVNMSTFLYIRLDIMNVKYTNDTTNNPIYQSKVINIITGLLQHKQMWQC